MSEEMKVCRFCKEEMRAGAGTCPHCGKEEAGIGGLVLGLIVTWPFWLFICFILYVALT